MDLRRGIVFSAALCSLMGCSSDDSGSPSGTGGASSGGETSSGGTSSGGASSGGVAAGGAQDTGGAGTGGASNGGAANGGASSGGAANGGASSGGTGSGGIASGGANSGGAGGGQGGAGGGGGAGSFTLTSSAYTEGMTIPPVHTCAGDDTSPPLAWTAGPAATKSYTLILTDKTNKLVHWALWDIPVGTLSLPAMLQAGMPAGTHESSIVADDGYAGPCPSGSLHTYQYDLYAVDVDTLPIPASSMQPAVVTSVMSHMLAVASLSGTSNARRP